MAIRRTYAPYLVVLLLALLPLARGASQEPAVLLQQAIQKETVDGNLRAAIEQYKKIIALQGVDRPTAARALLRLGQCHERLGQAEARQVYQQLISGFSDQKEQADAARERLSKLGDSSVQATLKPRFRKIQLTTRLYDQGCLSPDGTRFAYNADESVWVVPIPGKVHPDIAGVPTKLADRVGTWGPLSWSWDGRWILTTRMPSVIVMIPSAGGSVRELPFERSLFNPFDFRASLSADGKSVAFISRDGSNLASKPYTYIARVEGGTPIRLGGEFDPKPSIFSDGSKLYGIPGLAFSPDGRKLALLAVHGEVTLTGGVARMERHEGGLYIAMSDGANAVFASRVMGRASSPIWSTDGRMIAFLHADTSKSLMGSPGNIGILPLSQDGRALAPPTNFELPFRTQDFLAGWTSENKIGVLSVNESYSAVYIVPASGGRATQVSPRGGGHHPRWSPDGGRIYFRWGSGHIVSVPKEGGELREGPLRRQDSVWEFFPGGGNDVSPDGKMVVFCGATKGDRIGSHIWSIPIDGGEPSQLTTSGWSGWPAWSPDGKSVAFIESERSLKTWNIHIVGARGGEVRELTSDADGVVRAGIAWSPDGKSIAYFSKQGTINLMPVEGGAPTAVISLRDSPVPLSEEESRGLYYCEIAFSPDGRKLLYSFGGKPYVVDLQTRARTALATGAIDARVGKFDWSPDGETIAFTGESGGDRELWLMEDFMHLVAGRRP